jgi:monoamine oxidase
VADLVVAGAGMAGLVAAAEARRLGAVPVVREKLERPGGSMRLSSGVVWRHRELERFRAECPGGDAALQRLLFERLDADLRWLESLGAPVLARDTGNDLTTGVRFDTEGLTAALTEAAGDVRLSSALSEPEASAPTVLATGGFAASRELLREHVTRGPTTCCCARPRDRPVTGCAWASPRAPRRPRSTTFTLARCPPRPRA